MLKSGHFMFAKTNSADSDTERICNANGCREQMHMENVKNEDRILQLMADIKFQLSSIASAINNLRPDSPLAPMRIGTVEEHQAWADSEKAPARQVELMLEQNKILVKTMVVTIVVSVILQVANGALQLYLQAKSNKQPVEVKVIYPDMVKESTGFNK